MILAYMAILGFYGIPLVVVSRSAFRHWEKATWYYKLGAVFALAAFGITLLMLLVWISNANDPLAVLGFIYCLPLPGIIAAVTWITVWAAGSLIEKLVKSRSRQKLYNPVTGMYQ